MANQVAKDSTLDGGIEIETSSLDFDSSDSAAKPVDSNKRLQAHHQRKLGFFNILMLMNSDYDHINTDVLL
jgi:hypothetical protein